MGLRARAQSALLRTVEDHDCGLRLVQAAVWRTTAGIAPTQCARRIILSLRHGSVPRYPPLIMRIATYNLQRLRLRQRNGEARLDGARDGDDPRDGPEATPLLDQIDRRLTAQVLCEVDSDVVALQEVFDQATLDHFHDSWLVPAGLAPYPHRVCLPGNDGRGFNVALMSRRPLHGLISHAKLTAKDLALTPPAGIPDSAPVFRRDCLQAKVGPLMLFCCHFKAPYPDAEQAWAVRRLEASVVRRLIERETRKRDEALWLVLGDLNEPGRYPGEHPSAIAPLTERFGIDLLERMPEAERWSYHDPASGAYTRPDAMIASPALAARWPQATPVVLRAGLERGTTRYSGPHLVGVGQHRPHASDHAALAIDLPGL